MMQTIIDGLVQGSVYGLAAIGLSLIFGVVRVPHFAHGEAVMLGGMVGLALVADSGLPLLVGLVVGTLVATAFGLIVGAAVFYPLRELSEINLLITALALVFIVEAAATKIFGEQPRVIPGAPETSVHFLGAQVGVMRIIILAVALIGAVGLHLYVERSRTGHAMKALALNPSAARLMGIPVRRYWILAFAIGSALAGVGGVLLGTIVPVTPTIGALISLKSFIVIIFAGLGSIGGAYMGGLVLGLVEALGGSYISSGYINAFSIAFLVAVLLVRPQGMFAAGVARD
jgi:branched-chain amino acid transport system permease protein